MALIKIGIDTLLTQNTQFRNQPLNNGSTARLQNLHISHLPNLKRFN